MTALQIRLNDAALYDAVIQDSLPECGDLTIVTKDGGRESGRSCLLVTFSVQLPDGSIRVVQAATTVRLFKAAVAVFNGAYNDKGINIQQGRPQG